MILWLVLFLIIIAISFILAYQSMRDFVEKPASLKVEYGLFLIRTPLNLNTEILQILRARLTKDSQILSLEKLFKGGRSALVIYGPKLALESLSQLNLLELEEYTKVNESQFQAWEIGVKDSQQSTGNPSTPFRASGGQAVFGDMPQLQESEQVWWQMVLQPVKDKGFLSQVRVVVSADQNRLKELTDRLEMMGNFVRLPRSLTSTQILGLYQDRALQSGAKQLINLSSDQVEAIFR